uniref:Uncharacterized protein n=1 Tax=Rhizophora mucronata TaxID=61149 RepID=A0A2P2P7Q9_RHIMU
MANVACKVSFIVSNLASKYTGSIDLIWCPRKRRTQKLVNDT